MLKFAKYQGTGNDFVMIDNRSGAYNNLSVTQIQQLCDRKFGIGADGLIKLNAHSHYDFEVDYYNADGSKSFCGNGARCAVKFASDLGLNVGQTTFLAIDGVHMAWKKGELIELEMLDVTSYSKDVDAFILNTGSPHYVSFIEDVKEFDVVKFGRSIRYNETYFAEGINVNVAQKLSGDKFEIKTYERGVEDETLSCGTGVTAAALAFALQNNLEGAQKIEAITQGGICEVSFVRNENMFSQVRLIGPAELIFKGEVNVNI